MLALSLTVLTACGKTKDKPDEPKQNSDSDVQHIADDAESFEPSIDEDIKDVVQDDASTNDAKIAPLAELSDNLFSFQMQLDNTIITVPLEPYTKWEDRFPMYFDGDLDNNGKTFHTTLIVKEGESGYEVDAMFENRTDAIIKASDSSLVGINVTKDMIGAGLTAYFPQGITIGSTLGEVLSAYGEPTEIWIPDVGDPERYRYEVGGYSYMVVTIDPETKNVIGLTAYNRYADKVEQ